MVQATWDDTAHLSAKAKSDLASAYPPHERDARMRGVPQLGSGAIYPVPETDIVCEPFEFPAWYRHFYALDVGWNRTAAVWGAYNVEDDVLYLYSEYYRSQAEPAVHAAAVRARGEWIPGVVDPASRGRSQRDGEQLFDDYQALGLVLTKANNARETGLYEVWGRLSSGRLRIFKTLQNWLAEYRIYRRNEKGDIVKEHDHLMDCTRYGIMSGVAVSTVRPFEEWAARGMPQVKKARFESEYDPFAAARNVVGSQAPQRQGWMPGSSGGYR